MNNKYMRNYWVISSNVSADDSLINDWEKVINSTHRVFMGWGSDTLRGNIFTNKVKFDDVILIAQGSNANKRVVLAGIICSDVQEVELDGMPNSAYSRRLCNVLDYSILEQLNLKFDNDVSYGNSSQIPAIYQLHPSTKYGDELICSKLDKALSENKKKYSMKKYIELLKENKNIILTGAPGTGKTYLAKQIAKMLIGETISDKTTKLAEHDLNNFLNWLQSNGGLTTGVYSQYKSSIRSIVKEYKNFDNVIQDLPNIKNTFKPKSDSDPSGSKSAVLSKLDTYLIDSKCDLNGELIPRGKCKFVQFHPSYDYTDFVEGLRPIKETDSDNFKFELRDGIFKAFCNDALYDSENNYVFIIDEINRGEISKIFGELFFSIDPGYRGIKGKVVTQYANLQNELFDETLELGEFYIPENVYIIGTMNEIDRSVDCFDFAMKRRFTWIEVKAIDRIDMWDGKIDSYKSNAGLRLTALNKAIDQVQGLNSSYHIGPAYFLKLKSYATDESPFDKLWDYHIEPLLKEYLRGNRNAEEELQGLKNAYEGENN